jgi:hypothetical protein
VAKNVDDVARGKTGEKDYGKRDDDPEHDVLVFSAFAPEINQDDPHTI